MLKWHFHQPLELQDISSSSAESIHTQVELQQQIGVMNDGVISHSAVLQGKGLFCQTKII